MACGTFCAVLEAQPERRMRGSRVEFNCTVVSRVFCPLALVAMAILTADLPFKVGHVAFWITASAALLRSAVSRYGAFFRTAARTRSRHVRGAAAGDRHDAVRRR